jgi:eukaryotic translation initiation factor 2C
MVLWRGYFQSIRPAIGKMLINVDISTGVMYKAGPFIGLCCDFFGVRDIPALTRCIQNDRERLRLQRFITGIRFLTIRSDSNKGGTARTIKKITSTGADRLSFSLREGGQMTVADYFRRTQNQTLRHPGLPCVEVKFEIQFVLMTSLYFLFKGRIWCSYPY